MNSRLQKSGRPVDMASPQFFQRLLKGGPDKTPEHSAQRIAVGMGVKLERERTDFGQN
jgi:hypothetical protein